MATLSELIKTKRLLDNLSLREFSERCGLSHSYIEKLEKHYINTGKQVVPTIDSLVKIARALDMSLENLLIETGYIVDNSRAFEASTLKLIRKNISYVEISKDIKLKTGYQFDPLVYEDMETGRDATPSFFLVNILAKYSGVDPSFFYKRTTPREFELAKLYSPYPYLKGNSTPIRGIDSKTWSFVSSPDAIEYLKLAEELYNSKVDIQSVREAFLR